MGKQEQFIITNIDNLGLQLIYNKDFTFKFNKRLKNCLSRNNYDTDKDDID